MTLRGLAAALLLSLGLGEASSTYAQSNRTIFVEVYVGPRPADAQRLLAPMYAELGEKPGMMTGLGTQTEVRDRVSAPATALDAFASQEVERLLDDAYRNYENANFAIASQLYARAIGGLQASPATLVANARLREAMFNALWRQAMSYSKLGKADAATSAMADLIRTYPGRAPAAGTDVRTLYTQVDTSLDGATRGILEIVPSNPRAACFVNEQYVSTGSYVGKDRRPGTYRVFCQVTDAAGRAEAGRVHYVTLGPGEHKMTPIDWVFDTRLRSDGYLGFEFDSEAERARLEPAFVRRLATALGANHAIVVTVGKHEKRRALLAAYWSGDPWESRWNGGLFLEPVEPEVERIRKLASYLQDGSARRTVAAEEEGFFQTRRPAGRDSKGTSGWTVAKWTLTGVAIPMLALGTYWTFIECRMCDGEYTSYEHLRWGRVLFTAGAVSAVLAIELWILGVPRQRDPKSVTVIPVVGKTERGTWIFGAGGRF